jgi:hypothetical protein
VFPKLKIEVQGKEPVEVETLPVDFWVYEELNGDNPVSEIALKLTMAYYYTVGTEPTNLKLVKDWARRERVMVEIVKENVNPTETVATAD